MLCWLLIYNGNNALHAGAGRLLLDCCTVSFQLAGCQDYKYKYNSALPPGLHC